jgi:hypothetical protein
MIGGGGGRGTGWGRAGAEQAVNRSPMPSVGNGGMYVFAPGFTSRYRTPMLRLAPLCLVVAAAAPAAADSFHLPNPGDVMTERGNLGWPAPMEWLYDVPNGTDAAGKVIVLWFCGPKAPECTDDLSHLIQLKDSGKVYIVAYIDGSKSAAKKLDPIRESEGVGRGTVAYGRKVGDLMKGIGIKGPVSVVIDPDDKVVMVAHGSTATEFDARDAQVNKLSGAIKDYTWAANDPKAAVAGEKFKLEMTVTLSHWLKYTPGSPPSFQLTQLPKDFKCDAKKLEGDQIKIDGRNAIATVSCSAPPGNYEARGEMKFSYNAPAGGTGLGTEGAGWKLTVK